MQKGLKRLNQDSKKSIHPADSNRQRGLIVLRDERWSMEFFATVQFMKNDGRKLIGSPALKQGNDHRSQPKVLALAKTCP